MDMEVPKQNKVRCKPRTTTSINLVRVAITIMHFISRSCKGGERRLEVNVKKVFVVEYDVIGGADS